MNKTLISLFAVVAFVLSLTAVSALSLSASPSDITLANNKTVATLSSTDPLNLTLSLSPASGLTFLSTPTLPLTLNNFNGTSTVNITLDTSTVKFGRYSSTLSVSATNASNSSQTVSVSPATFTFTKSFCSKGEVGNNLTIEGVDITNNGEGDDTEWHLLDNIVVEVDVRNDGDSDLSDINVELAIFDSSGNDVTGDLTFINSDEDQIDLGKINNGKRETATFEFQVSPDFGDDDYRLAVKAYSKKSGLSESILCADTSADLDETFYQNIDIQKETDEGKRIGFDNIKFSPTEATCGDTVTVSFDAINIGDEDEDQVKISVRSKDLKVDQFVELKGGLDIGDSEEVSFTFQVPSGLADKVYTLDISAEYDYNRGAYRQELDEDFPATIKVFGCSAITTPTSSGVSLTATLASDAKAGQVMTVLSTIKNTGASAASFVIDASGYDSWATLGSISERIVTLNAGESKDITVTLNVNKGVSGDKTFVLDAKNGAQATSKTVSVNFASSEAISGLGGNTMLWVIGLVNLILVIVIIIVAVRVSRR